MATKNLMVFPPTPLFVLAMLKSYHILATFFLCDNPYTFSTYNLLHILTYYISVMLILLLQFCLLYTALLDKTREGQNKTNRKLPLRKDMDQCSRSLNAEARCRWQNTCYNITPRASGIEFANRINNTNFLMISWIHVSWKTANCPYSYTEQAVTRYLERHTSAKIRYSNSSN